MPDTFDSRRTPKPGEKRKEPKSLAPVDLAKLGEKMAATRERAKATDPKLLQTRVRELEAALSHATPTVKLTERQIKVPILTAKDRERIDRMNKVAEKLGTETMAWFANYRDIAIRLTSALNGVASANETGRLRRESAPSRDDVRARSESSRSADTSPVHAGREMKESRGARTTPSDGEPLTSAQHKILNALAWLRSVGKVEASREAIGALAGFKPTSGTFGVHINRLLQRGFVAYPTPGHVELTGAGMQNAEAPDHPLTTHELHEALYRKLPSAQAGILRELIAVKGQPIARSDLAQLVGASPTSGTFGVHINRLYEYGFATYPRPGYVAAADVLFLDRAVA